MTDGPEIIGEIEIVEIVPGWAPSPLEMIRRCAALWGVPVDVAVEMLEEATAARRSAAAS